MYVCMNVYVHIHTYVGLYEYGVVVCDLLRIILAKVT